MVQFAVLVKMGMERVCTSAGNGAAAGSGGSSGSSLATCYACLISPAMDKTKVDWERLDKQKFFVVGAGLFTVRRLTAAAWPVPPLLRRSTEVHSHRLLFQGLTTCLYPLSVIKTRQMALEGSQSGLKVRSLRCCWR